MNTSKESMTDRELIVLYSALCAYVRTSESRREFHNGDPGHPVYSMGAAGKESHDLSVVDGPERNSLFLIGKAIHDECCCRSPKFFEDCFPHDFDAVFSSWERFCEVASDRP